MDKAEKRDTLFLVFLYCSCCLLVFLYVNLYPLFKVINSHFGSKFILIAPFLLPAIFSFALLWVSLKRQGQKTSFIKWRWLVFGTGCCIFALFIPDAQFSVKRIHVAEYLLLSLLVRYTLSHRLEGFQLLLLSCLLTGLLGIHDEFLQGLHPSRTYGLRDMFVNGVAGAGGGCIWHGLQLFTKSAQGDNGAGQQIPLIKILYLGWLSVSVLAMVIPISQFLHFLIPLWTILPLATIAVVWSCLLLHCTTHSCGEIYGISVVSCCSVLFLIYPILINVFKIPFY